MTLFNRIAIIGLGLIGSSIARAAHERKLAKTIVGCDTDAASLALARGQKFIDIATQDAKEAVKGSGLIFLATPPSTLEHIAKEIAPYLESGAIVTDVCSVKQAAINAIAPHIPDGTQFIPAHPIAGSERSGAAAGKADLFEHKYVIVTPSEPKQTEGLLALSNFWLTIGARVQAMPPAVHDEVYAHVSQLPHLLAFAAAKTLAKYKDDKNLGQFLRIGHSNPHLWVEIFLLNKDNMLAALDRYLDALNHIAGELKKAPADNPSDNDETLSHTLLFPRIAASCLITTVMEAERRAGFMLRRYAGTGFADFTSPAAAPPDENIEQISGHCLAVAAILEKYIERLKAIRATLADENIKELKNIII